MYLTRGIRRLFPVASDGFVIGKYVINFDANEPRYLPEIRIIVSFPVCFAQTHTHTYTQTCLLLGSREGERFVFRSRLFDSCGSGGRNFLKFQTCVGKVCEKEEKEKN